MSPKGIPPQHQFFVGKMHLGKCDPVNQMAVYMLQYFCRTGGDENCMIFQRFRSYNTISDFSKDGLLMVPKTRLMVLTDEMPNKVQELFSFTDALDCFRVTDYEFLPDNKLLVYTQFYDSDCYHDSDPPLHKHLFDRVYILNEHYHQEMVYTTFSQQIILHADKNRVVILDGRTVRSVDYEGEELKTLGQIAPYGNALQAQVCGNNLLFFSNGQMISSVSFA